MWIFFAFGSALFAGLTAILAKCGIRKTDSTVATAIRTIVVLAFSWLMVFITGSQGTISSISGRTLLFLVLSGLATGASWLCYFRALQIGDVNKVVPVDKSSTVLTILLAVLFLQELPHNKTQKFLRYAAYAAMGLGIWCNVIYANQSYLKVALEEKATDALMVRVVGRLEQTEGYVPGETPIAVVGLLPTSPLYKTMDGFEDVRGRTADAYTVSWENTYYLYMENVLNYPVKRSYLTKDDQAAVDAMPTFPADGCCAFIGDTLVVKVGSVVVTDLQ